MPQLYKYNRRISVIDLRNSFSTLLDLGDYKCSTVRANEDTFFEMITGHFHIFLLNLTSLV